MNIVKVAAAIAVLSGALLCAGGCATVPTVNIPTQGTNSVAWVGHPMVSDNAPYTPSEEWLSNVEIGLRSDGVVVWKIIERK